MINKNLYKICFTDIIIMIVSIIVIFITYINKKYNNNSHEVLFFTILTSYFICILEFSILFSNLYFIINFLFFLIIFFIIDLITTILLLVFFCIQIPLYLNTNKHLMIYEKEDEFECLICYNTSKKYYDIQCTNIEHILCEDCINNPLMNMKKCPWCNINVNLLYVV